jgi:hypothetical protein
MHSSLRAIRDAIPRLRNLRLLLSALCESLFSADSAPTLESVSVNYVHAGLLLGGTQLCSSLNGKPGAVGQASETDAVATVAPALQALTSLYSRLEFATELGETPNDYEDRTTHPCYNFRDAITNRAHVGLSVEIWALEKR